MKQREEEPVVNDGVDTSGERVADDAGRAGKTDAAEQDTGFVKAHAGTTGERQPDTAASTPERDPNAAAEAGGKTSIPTSDPSKPETVHHKKFPTWVDFLVLVGMFLVIQLVVSLIMLIAGVQMPSAADLASADPAIVRQAHETAARFNLYTYPLIMGVMIVATLLYRRARKGNRQFGRYATRGLNPVLILWGFVLMLAVNIALEPLLQLLPPIPDFYGRGFKTILLTVVLAPIAEEFLCRGILLDAARAKGGVVYGLLFSSLFFGVIHFYPAAVINAFVMGLVLGFIYIRANSLYIVVILHAFNNALALLALMLGYGNTTLYALLVDNGHATLYTVIYGISLGVFLIAGYMVWKTIARLRDEEQQALRAQ